MSIYSNKDDDAGQNKTVKPTATMSLYSGGNAVDGATVKLTDQITMVMQLDTEYIRAYCLMLVLQLEFMPQYKFLRNART